MSISNACLFAYNLRTTDLPLDRRKDGRKRDEAFVMCRAHQAHGLKCRPVWLLKDDLRKQTDSMTWRFVYLNPDQLNTAQHAGGWLVVIVDKRLEYSRGGKINGNKNWNRVGFGFSQMIV